MWARRFPCALFLSSGRGVGVVFPYRATLVFGLQVIGVAYFVPLRGLFVGSGLYCAKPGGGICGREYGILRDERGILLSVYVLVSVYLHVRISTGGFGSGGGCHLRSDSFLSVERL